MEDKTRLYILMGILGVLIMFSGVQAYQIGGLSEDIETFEPTAATSSGGPVDSGPSVPTSLKDLPTMVGGC